MTARAASQLIIRDGNYNTNCLKKMQRMIFNWRNEYFPSIEKHIDNGVATYTFRGFSKE